MWPLLCSNADFRILYLNVSACDGHCIIALQMSMKKKGLAATLWIKAIIAKYILEGPFLMFCFSSEMCLFASNPHSLFDGWKHWPWRRTFWWRDHQQTAWIYESLEAGCCQVSLPLFHLQGKKKKKAAFKQGGRMGIWINLRGTQIYPVVTLQLHSAGWEKDEHWFKVPHCSNPH